MSKKRHDAFPDRLRLAPHVTQRHGQIFAKLFLAESLQTEEPIEAFGLTNVIEWPDHEEDNTPAKMRYEDLQGEILRRTFDAVQKALCEAFVRIATDVIERERRRQRGDDKS